MVFAKCANNCFSSKKVSDHLLILFSSRLINILKEVLEADFQKLLTADLRKLCCIMKELLPFLAAICLVEAINILKIVINCALKLVSISRIITSFKILIVMDLKTTMMSRVPEVGFFR